MSRWKALSSDQLTLDVGSPLESGEDHSCEALPGPLSGAVMVPALLSSAAW